MAICSIADECQNKYGNANAWRYCCRVFDLLTIAAVCSKTFFNVNWEFMHVDHWWAGVMCAWWIVTRSKDTRSGRNIITESCDISLMFFLVCTDKNNRQRNRNTSHWSILWLVFSYYGYVTVLLHDDYSRSGVVWSRRDSRMGCESTWGRLPLWRKCYPRGESFAFLCLVVGFNVRFNSKFPSKSLAIIIILLYIVHAPEQPEAYLSCTPAGSWGHQVHVWQPASNSVVSTQLLLQMWQHCIYTGVQERWG